MKEHITDGDLYSRVNQLLNHCEACATALRGTQIGSGAHNQAIAYADRCVSTLKSLQAAAKGMQGQPLYPKIMDALRIAEAEVIALLLLR